MNRSLPNPSLFKKTNQLGAVVLAVVLGVFCLAFTSSDKVYNSTFTFCDFDDSGASPYSIVGPNDTVDLALVVTTPNTFSCPGSQVDFTIEIINQGMTTVESFELTNYVPAGLTLSPTGNTGWVQTGDKVKKTVTGSLNPNGFTTESISFELDSDFSGASLENRVEISAADCDTDPNNAAPFELDSTFDDIDNDSIGGDNIIDGSFGDEDDHDFATVMNDAPQLTNVDVTSSLCNFDNGTVTLSPTGFMSYSWSDGGTGSARTGLFPGLYTVTFTKNNGCANTEEIEVTNDCTGCEAIAGTVTMDADTFCIPGDSVLVTFIDDMNSVIPQPQFIKSYFLTRGDSKAIIAVDTLPQFYVYEKGMYRVHIKIFDALHIPQEEIDSVEVGVTSIIYLNQFLQDGGGYLCGDLDTTGVQFEVGDANATVTSTSNEDCGSGNGYALLDPIDYTYAWSDGGTGHERADLVAGVYSVTVTGCADCIWFVNDITIETSCVLNDTIPFIIETDSTETFCGNPIPDYFSNNTTTTLCAGGTSGGDGTYGSYSVSETGCLIYTSNSLPGSNIDTICVVVNDDMGNSDTTVFIPTIICHTIPQIINVACDVTTSTGDLCLEIPFDDIGNFNVTVDGVPVSTGFIGCQADSTIVYDYSGLFAQGNFGPYDLDSWVVEGQDLIVSFQNIQVLLDEMNDWDPAANWVLNTTDLTISGGDLDQEYEDLIITHPLTNATISIPPLVVYNFAGTSLEISEGLHTIIYTEVGNNCPTASIQATVSCAPCVPFLPADTVDVVAANCLGTGDFCVNVSTANIFEYQILVDGSTYGGSLMACDFAGTNDGTNLQLNVGLHEIIFTRITTACSDTVLVEVTCPPCNDWLTDVVTLETTTCGSTVETCINVPAATLSDYEIRDNGSLYVGSIGTCMNGTDATIAVDTGFHQITMLNLLSGCIDTMSLTINCVPDTLILDTLIEITSMDTLCLDEMLVGDLAMVEVICGDTINATVNYTIDTMTNCIIFEGVNLGVHMLCLRLTNNLGDRTDIILNITVTPPCGDGFINMDSATLGISDCAGTTPLCLEIPLGQIAAYNITDNGMAYANGFVGCDFDTSYSYNYFALPAQGTAGPYNVDLWMINDSIYSGMFMTIVDLVDSMNVWDTTGTWTLNTATFNIEGGNNSSNYGNITITQNGTGAFALLELTESLTPNGTQILIGDGPHELIFSDTTTLCQDTIQASVFCLDTEIVIDTIMNGTMDSYCVDTTELLGNVISISNACPIESGDMVAFEIVDSTYCVNYEGLNPGENTACIVVCDDLGLCDTTIIIVTVLVDTLSLPDVITDADTTVMGQMVVTNLLGNDTINGIFDTMYILTQPTNGTVVMNGDGTATYTPNEGFCNPTIPDSYNYVMCNTSGCDSTLVTILVLCESSGELTFYSGFSPNGDGINDIFYVQGLEDFPDNVLCVFNRWGNRVYYKEGYDNSFDGTWENIRLTDGTYFYVFDDGFGNRYSGYVQIAR
ncbi:MAG: gliding motility-associated C-terminal domain-containing protein [Saprospiraceae bacterium]